MPQATFVAFSALALLLQLQPPSPTPAKPSEKPQQAETSKPRNTDANQRPAEPAPTAIHVSQAPQSQNHGSSTGQQVASGPTSDWWLVGFTGALVLAAFFQLVAMLIQAHYMRRSLEETRRATDAARETYVSANRPQLALRWMWTPDDFGNMKLNGHFWLFNTGETVAILKQSYSDVIVSDHLPARAPYEDKAGRPFADAELRPGQSIRVEFPTVRGAITRSEYITLRNCREAARSGKDAPDHLYVIGWIEYIDEAKQQRRMGFCRRYNFRLEVFEREPHPDYEYGDQG